MLFLFLRSCWLWTMPARNVLRSYRFVACLLFGDVSSLLAFGWCATHWLTALARGGCTAHRYGHDNRLPAIVIIITFYSLSPSLSLPFLAAIGAATAVVFISIRIPFLAGFIFILAFNNFCKRQHVARLSRLSPTSTDLPILLLFSPKSRIYTARYLHFHSAEKKMKKII